MVSHIIDLIGEVIVKRGGNTITHNSTPQPFTHCATVPGRTAPEPGIPYAISFITLSMTLNTYPHVHVFQNHRSKIIVS